MSSSFDQPDDAASWQWYRGKVRSTHEMLSDVEAALELVEEAIESEVIESDVIESEATQCQFSDSQHPDSQHPDSQHPDTLFPGGDGFSTGDASGVSEVQHITAPDPDFGNLGEPLLVASAGSLLQQIALIQQAVSVAIVTSQCEQSPSEVDSSNNAPVVIGTVDIGTVDTGTVVRGADELCTDELDHFEMGHVEVDHVDGKSGHHAQSRHCQDIRISTGDLSGFRCCQCHLPEQQHGLWLEAVRAAGNSSFPLPSDVKADNTPSGVVQDKELLIPVSLGIETKTLYVAFDGQQFVKVARPVGNAEAANSSTGNSTGGASADELQADQRDGGKEGKSPLMQRRNETTWGPHWTAGTRAEQGSSQANESNPDEPSLEGCADNEVFRQPADQRHALPGNDAARSRLRKNAAKSRCLRYNATQETCREVPPSSRNSAGCRDRRSCKVRDQKGDQ
ncbi:MAG: hypothetical protein ACR2N1_09945 [Rubripirellula sp.]